MSAVNFLCRLAAILLAALAATSPLFVVYASQSYTFAGISGITFALLGLVFWWMGNVHDFLRGSR
jgi:hypothetical protein